MQKNYIRYKDLIKLIKICDRIIACMVCITTILTISLVDLISTNISFASENIPITISVEPVKIEPEPLIVEKVVSVKTKPIVSSIPSTSVSEVHVLKKEPKYRMEIDDKTLEVLTRVVEAEVTGSTYRYQGEEVSYEELLKSKIRVAQVFMNRVEDTDSFDFIDDLYTSLTYKNASSTFNDGRYYEVTITDITREAVELALLADTPDYTDGALYFSSGTTTCKYGDYIFTDAVGHSFFK